MHTTAFPILLNFLTLFCVQIFGQGTSDVSTLKKYPLVVNKDVEGCVCIALYDPVCGSDGRTYSNGCVLGCERKNNPYVFGICKGECPCCKPPYYNDPSSIHGGGSPGGWDHPPPLGPQSSLYPPPGQDICDYPPFADPSCICTLELAPVCGNDGKTYSNACALGCQQKIQPCLQEACKGECPCCACPNLFPQPIGKNLTSTSAN